MTKCGHNFENLRSYIVDYVVDYVVINDNGLTEEEIELIKGIVPADKLKIFKTVFKDYSSMRNVILENVPKETDYVICADDSWELRNFDRTKLKNDGYYVNLVYPTGEVTTLLRIFKPWRRFISTVHEYVPPISTDSVLENCYFLDTHTDHQRSLTKLQFYLNSMLAETKIPEYRRLYYIGYYYQRLGNVPKANEYYRKFLELPVRDPLLEYKVYCYLALINEDVEWYRKAVPKFPQKREELLRMIRIVSNSETNLESN